MARRTHAASAAAALTLAFLLAVPATEAIAADSGPRHVWLDAAGEPLPFQDDADIEKFLKEARVVGREAIGVGINKMDKLLIERDGVRAHAIFRTIDVEHERLRVGDRVYMRFKDSWTGECAAYAITRLFDLDNVPPTVERFLDRDRGAMQIWVEDTRDHAAKDFSPPSPLAWARQTWGMFIFDNLIFNVDRNSGNMLAGEDYKLWLIDHTRAFQPNAELMSPDRVERLKREAWERLLEVSGDAMADATRDYLDAGQLNALKKRRDLLVEHIEARIEELGEDAVLY